jgi:tetratricopeptide (TPR) repeat protein
MPVARKPPRKTAAKAPEPKETLTGDALPDRKAMERYLASIAGKSPVASIARAQEIIYDAWERTTSRSRITLARKALAISPLCADAYNLLAREAGTVQEARDLYALGVEAGELALGPEGFEEYAGYFWGFLETRPYMRARAGLAIALIKLGDESAAIEHFRDMLKLNPGDNQGIRYLLLGCLLRRDDMAAVKKLLAAYKDEWSACWLYTRALIAFRDGQGAEKKVARLVKDAWSANQHVPAILAGAGRPVTSGSGYITEGGAGEATEYVRDCGQAWQQTPGAIAWLNNLVSVLPKKPRRSGTIH